MKKFILIVFVSFLQITLTAQWTSQNPIPDGNSLRSVFFINNNIGWIVGSDGFISKTLNAGVTWNQKSIATTNTLKKIFFTDISVGGIATEISMGWIVGENGLIMRSNDGGESWIPQNSGTSETLNSVFFANRLSGWAVGNNGTILRTFDGGNHWRIQNSGTNLPIYDVNFINSKTGYAVGGDGFGSELIIKSTDGGNIWVAKPSGGEGVLYSVSFVSETDGWAVGLEKKILHTSDGGDNWTIQNINKSNLGKIRSSLIDGPGGLRSVYFKDKNNGWAVGGENEYDRTIYTTTNGGVNWINQYFGSEEYDLFSVSVTPSGNSWAVGGGGTIFYSENGYDWVQQFSGYSNYNGDDIFNIQFIDTNTAFASGFRNDFIEGNGLVLKSTNGGATWLTSYLDQNSGEPYKALFFTDADNGWAAEYSSLIRHTTDGGNSWENQTLGCSFSVNSLFFTNSLTGFASGEKIYKTTDSGNSWNLKYTGSINSLFFIDSNKGWGIGNNIIKTTDSGETWIEQDGIGGNSIYFVNDLEGWAVGNNGTIRKTTDGGNSWLIQTSGTAENLRSVRFVDNLRGWAGGSNGVILTTSNGGSVWNLQNSNTDRCINTLFFVNQNLGWAGGANGTLLKYNNQFGPPSTDVSSTSDDTGLTKNSDGIIPTVNSLQQNYPNPFNPRTTINYSLEQSGLVSLRIYDITGREVASLVNENKSAGNYSVDFNAGNLASGMYIYILKSGNFIQTKKLLLLK